MSTDPEDSIQDIDMDTGGDDKSSSDAPEGFTELVRAIESTYKPTNDDQLQEKVFTEAFEYIKRNTPGRHWFCDKYMYPVTLHILIVFSFPTSDVSRWIRARIEENTEECQLCMIQYHKGKSHLRRRFILEKNFAVGIVQNFINLIDKWEAETAHNALVPFAENDISNGSSIDLEKVEIPLVSCFMNPNILRLDSELKVAVMKIFMSCNKTNFEGITEPNSLVPGLLYFLYEGNGEQQKWARMICKQISERHNYVDAEATLGPFLDEFEIWFYQIQNARYFSDSACLLFWQNFLTFQDCISKETLMGELNSPKDLDSMSRFHNLQFYSLVKVLANQLFSFSKRAFPILLRAFNVLLTRLGPDFWSISAYPFQSILDTLLQSPLLIEYINELPVKQAVQDSNAPVLCDILNWMSSMVKSLNDTQSQITGVRLGAFLLRIQGVNKTNTEACFRIGFNLLKTAMQFSNIANGEKKSFSIEILKKRDCRAAIDNCSPQIVDSARSSESEFAISLISVALDFDISSLSHNSKTLQDGNMPNSFDTFPILWMELLKPSAHQSASKIKIIAEVIKSFSNVCGIIKFEPKKNSQVTTDKKFQAALEQHNKNAQLITSYIVKWLEQTILVDPEVLKQELFYNKERSIGYWSCVLSPQTNQAAVDILYQTFDEDGGRLESIQSLFHLKNVEDILESLNHNLTTLISLKAFEPCPKAVRILMDIIDALADPLNGVLISSSNVGSEGKDQLKLFWKKSWEFLVMIYQGALIWANHYHIEGLIEFTRDTLDLSRKLLDSFLMILDVVNGGQQDGDVKLSLFSDFVNAFHYVIVWLRLGDLSLLNSCVELVFKGFDLAKDLNFSIDKEFLINFTKYGAKAKKFNNKLTENQRQAILSKAREFDDDVVEDVLWEVQEQKQKSNALKQLEQQQQQQQIKEQMQTQKAQESGAMYKYQTHVKQPKQQTLGRFGVVTKEAPIAPPPKTIQSSSLDAIRQSLQQSRSRVPPPKPINTVAPAAARPAGFNSKANATAVGRSLNSLKKKRHGTDSSSDEEDGDDAQEDGVDLSDLFVEKKKKAKIVEVDIAGRPILTKPSANSISRHLNEKRREEERMRMRLNVSLKPLYSTILKWNYNSVSEYPTKDTEAYKPTKDTYVDAKDYIKITEPLLMLECWQGIQSTKQTGNETPFELSIGSRTSCDGFFDVYASIRKDILQDRKIGDSDLVVLGHLEGKSMNSAKEVQTYMKNPQAITCLAKVREIKSANVDFADITLRVFPQGSMMSVLTPKSIITGMKVMQMVTIEREYSSLKGLEYYDLADKIFRAEPEPPQQISDIESANLESSYGVNKSQAKAILGTFDREGFSLIQGPPGTGKTKTILGIVGYYLSKTEVEGKITIESDSSRDSSPAKEGTGGPKILVCAPSNAAVDELVLRLRNGVKNKNGKEITPRVVRMGRSDAINASVRDLTLEELVEKHLASKQREASATMDSSLREEHTKCIAKRNKLREDLQNPDLEPEAILKLEEQMRDVNKRRNELGKKLDEQREKVSIAYRTREIERRQMQAKILNEAQIICSTLSGSAHDFLSSLSIRFDQVIIDEACQCVELSAVIPLRYGCKKCIMVGDPNQLPPTVLSQKAASLNYEQSLFVRMQKLHPNSVYLLDVQYRMHPEISRFPSKEFYGGRLHDGDGMAKKNERPWHKECYPLTPYRFFDVVGKHQQNQQSKSLYNQSEAFVVMEMVEKLMEMLPKKSFGGRIGVISPYKEQIRTLKNIFRNKYGIGILNEIDFNTVDGYQGQEKEIIIMSCVRASPSGNVGFLSDVRRMNVALTRARTSLWILGNKESLMRNKVWNHLISNAETRGEVTKAYPGFLKDIKKPKDQDIGSENTESRKTATTANGTEVDWHSVNEIGGESTGATSAQQMGTAYPDIQNKKESSYTPHAGTHPKSTKQSRYDRPNPVQGPNSSSKASSIPSSVYSAQHAERSDLSKAKKSVHKKKVPYIHNSKSEVTPNKSGTIAPPQSSKPNAAVPSLPSKPQFPPSVSSSEGESSANKPTASGTLPPRKRPTDSSIFISSNRKKKRRPIP